MQSTIGRINPVGLGNGPRKCLSRIVQCRVITVVGGGRVGSALMSMGDSEKVLVKRGDGIATTEGPIIVCTRNDALAGVVEATPADRRKDLVFIQNGMLQPWLDSQDLGSCTQALIYFAVAKLGEAPTDGKTRTNPAGLTAVCGEHAGAVQELLQSGGLSCKVLDSPEYTKCMLEKLIWISAFMLIGVRNGGCTVGEVASVHTEEVGRVIAELAAAGEQELGIKLDDGLVDRLCAYGESVAGFPTALKEQEWRNGWFLGLSKKALDAGQPDPCPLHSQWISDAMST
eukprot:jgi/Ulvmu1/488/UM001_0496.1